MSRLLLLLLFSILAVDTRAQETPLFHKYVDIADYPYHVSVRREGQHVCSGALVHESWIITAASCVYDSSVPKVSVLLGSAELGKSSKGSRRSNVSKIIPHQSFDKFLLTNNIALLKIETTTSFRSVLLPSSGNYHLKEGSELVVSGWKKIQAGAPVEEEEEERGRRSAGFESQLSVTGAPLVNQRTCIRSMPSYKAVSGKMLCAGYTYPGYPNAGRTCQTDVGAPLVNHDILVGILSSADGCATSKYPGVYTRVSSFLPWISKLISLDQNK